MDHGNKSTLEHCAFPRSRVHHVGGGSSTSRIFRCSLLVMRVVFPDVRIYTMITLYREELRHDAVVAIGWNLNFLDVEI